MGQNSIKLLTANLEGYLTATELTATANCRPQPRLLRSCYNQLAAVRPDELSVSAIAEATDDATGGKLR